MTFWRYKTMWSLGTSIPNGNTILETAINDQVYLSNAFDSFKYSTKARLPEKPDEKELTFLKGK